MKRYALYYRDPNTRQFTRIPRLLGRFSKDGIFAVELHDISPPDWVRRQTNNAVYQTIYMPSYWRRE